MKETTPLSPQERKHLQLKLQQMNVQDRASFGLVAKYKCFEPYEKARACAQRVYETNEAVRRKMLELQDTKDQQEFLHESYTYILQKCEGEILKIGDCIVKAQLAPNQ